MSEVKALFQAIKDMNNEELVALIQTTKSTAVRNKASERLVVKNRGLVRRVAHSFPIWNTQFDDREQDGMLGLLKAVHNFKPEKGVKFGTHAWNWIKQSIIREGNKQGNIIQCPSYIAEARMKVNKVRNKFMKETGKFPTVEDLEGLCAIEPHIIQEILEQSGTVAGSMDTPIGGDEGEELSAYDVHGGSTLIGELLSDHNRQVLLVAISKLSIHEKFLVEMVLGLGEDGENYTYAELAGLAKSSEGKTLGHASTVCRHYHAALEKMLQFVKVEKAVNAEDKKQPLTFELLMSYVGVEKMLSLIDTLHENEQFILLAVNGMLDGDDEKWDFEELAGSVFDSQETPLDEEKHVQAEYNNIMRELEYKIKQQA